MIILYMISLLFLSNNYTKL